MYKRIKLLVGDFLMNVAYFFANKSQGYTMMKRCFLIYKSFLSLFGMKVLPITTIKAFADRNKDCKRYLIKSLRTGVSICSSAPFEKEDVPQKKALNDLYITLFNNVLITGGTDIIIDDLYECIISDFCVNKSNNIYSSDNLLCREKNNWGLLRRVISRKPTIIESGVMISGKFPKNYYHCIYENLNRCMMIDDSIIPRDIPLLVDNSVMSIPSLKKLVLFMIQGTSRTIIPINSGILYRCHKLYYIDHINFIIPHHRKLSISLDERSYYDPELVNLQRNLLLKNKANASTPPRVFLTRANSSARLYNEDEVFNEIKNWGFEKVAPEKLPIEEQICLFYNAEFIIGGSGAAFSNILFCQPGCKVLCFRPIQSNDGTPLFKTIASINGVGFWHYQADRVQGKDVHSNYYISPSKLKSTLTKLWNIS